LLLAFFASAKHWLRSVRTAASKLLIFITNCRINVAAMRLKFVVSELFAFAVEQCAYFLTFSSFANSLQLTME